MVRMASKKTVFHDFWSCRPQSKSIWSRIWRWSWFWRPFGCSSSKISPNSRKSKVLGQKIEFFLNRFFDVLVVAKHRRRLEFWQRVALDFLDAPERPTSEIEFIPRIFAKTPKLFFKGIQKKRIAIACFCQNWFLCQASNLLFCGLTPPLMPLAKGFVSHYTVYDVS